MSKIAADIAKHTQVKIKPLKKRQEYLGALAKAAREISDDAWDNLTEAAQCWINEATTAQLENRAIPELPDVGGTDDDDDAEESNVSTKKSKSAEAEKPAKKTKPEVAEKTTKKTKPEVAEKSAKKTKSAETEKPAKKAKPEAEKPAKKTKSAETEKTTKKTSKSEGKTSHDPQKRTVSARRRIKLLVIKNPRVTFDDLVTQIQKEGYDMTATSISSIRNDTLDTISVLAKSDKLVKGFYTDAA